MWFGGTFIVYRVSQTDSRIDSVFVEGRSFVKMNLDAMALHCLCRS